MIASKKRAPSLLALILVLFGFGVTDALVGSVRGVRSSAGLAAEVSRAVPGDNCDSPYQVTLDWNTLPFYLSSESTCDRGNYYDSTCLGYYDGGEDFIMEITLPQLMSLMFTLNPKGTTYTGMSLSDHCPPDSDCIAVASQYGSNYLTLEIPLLEPGTYYLMVDNWPDPGCIPDFDLEISEIFFDNPGHQCGFPLPVDISPTQLPVYLDYLYTCGAEDDYNGTCLESYDGGEDFVLQFTVNQAATCDIVLDPQGTSYTGMVLDDVCPPGHAECIAMSTSTSGSPHQISNVVLDPGEYYLMVDTWPAPDCIPQFSILIDGAFNHAMGDNCDLPQYLALPDDLPITLSHQYTWGRGDDYNNTCLGDFDEGEDYVMQLDVSSAVCVNISLDPHRLAGTAFALFTGCPSDTGCIVSSSNAAATAHGVTDVSLDAGTYYLLVDCTASAGSIEKFDLAFEPCPSHPANDDIAGAIATANVVDLSFSTIEATFDGPGVCQEAPNIWYCYTPPGTGVAEISLCGSSYDTRLAVYRGCDLDSIQELLACSDDDCDLQSLAHVEVIAGQAYLIEIGGSGGATGEGSLTAYISTYICGDINSDMMINISDVVYLIAYIFGGGQAPDPFVAADVDCNAIVNISDAVYMMMRIFGGGPAPCAQCQ